MEHAGYLLRGSASRVLSRILSIIALIMLTLVLRRTGRSSHVPTHIASVSSAKVTLLRMSISHGHWHRAIAIRLHSRGTCGEVRRGTCDRIDGVAVSWLRAVVRGRPFAVGGVRRRWRLFREVAHGEGGSVV